VLIVGLLFVLTTQRDHTVTLRSSDTARSPVRAPPAGIRKAQSTHQRDTGPETPQSPAPVSTPAEDNPAESKPFNQTDLVEKVEPSIVQIETDLGVGSGFIIDESGLIVTNYHVIDGATRATATFSNGLSAQIAGWVVADRRQDLVILCTETTERITVIPIGFGVPRNGESVIALGSSRGSGITVTEGTVSAIRSGEQVREVIGEAFSAMGFDPEATWIQTTAAISAGNSGGPLVTMEGKVVGVNTRMILADQNVNFAVSAEVIGKLMQDMPKKPSPLGEFPGDNGQSIPVAPHARVNITLPSVAKLTEAMLEIPKQWQDKLFPKEAIVFIARYSNDTLQGVFTLSNAKLDGWAAMLYEDGHLQTLASYKEAKLHGPLRQWQENGERLLYAYYGSNNKHGLVCFFQNGTPWLIQECDKGQIQSQYLVKWTKDLARAVPAEQLAGDEIAEMAKACRKLDALEEKMKRNEPILKRQLRDWFVDERDKARREQFKESAPDRKRDQSERIQGHNAQKRAAWESNWRNTLERSLPYSRKSDAW
jgi:S1-C subfamily serine protease